MKVQYGYLEDAMADLIRERVGEVVQETLMHGLKYQNDVNGSCYIDEWWRS